MAFGVPVTKYEPDNDSKLAEALIYANQKVPVVTGFVASTADQKKAAFAVPINMLSAAYRTYAMANLAIDSDSFVRRQELLRNRRPASPTIRSHEAWRCAPPKESQARMRSFGTASCCSADGGSLWAITAISPSISPVRQALFPWFRCTIS